MTKNSHAPYTCPRCGYQTRHKPTMRYHLFTAKKICPTIVADVALTEEIKEHVINNRVYHMVSSQKVLNQNVTNYNIINNIIAGMDFIDKLKQITHYKQIELLDFESKVEDTYHRNVQRLQDDNFKYGFMLKNSDFLDIINTLTQAIRGPQKHKFLEVLNVLYDGKKKRIKVYASEKWEEYLVDKGLTYLVDTIAAYYLESYECYLIRKIDGQPSVSAPERAAYVKCLEEYYHFIASFDVHPYVKDKSADDVFKDDEYLQTSDCEELIDKYNAMYGRIYDNMTNAEKKESHKRVLDILKTNSEHNVEELDKDIMGLIKLDEGFKETIMQQFGFMF
jgi:hypothetical protein